MKSSITISRAVFAFGVLAILGLSAVVLASRYALSELEVGGPIYDRIKLGNDLVADILPPPEYVIEAYLEATLALLNPASLAERRSRLAQLRKDYDERRDYWSKSGLDPLLKSKLVERSDAEVKKFWSLIEGALLPALARQDTAAAEQADRDIAAVYTAHRTLIDDIVKQANDVNAAAEAEAASRARWLTVLLWSLSAVVLLLVAGGIAAIGKAVIAPIVNMTRVMQRLAGGDLDSQVPSLGRSDEVGAMAQALQVFKESGLRIRSMEAEQLRSARQAEEDRKADMRKVAEGFETAVGAILRTVSTASGDIEAAAGDLSETAQSTEQLSAAVATASQQSSANVQSAAAASEQLAASVVEIGRKVQQSQTIAQAAVQQAEQTNVRIAELSQSAQRIDEVVKMITAVAEQTNLLALNATIEAARAGEAGRGFAVVASEVKALSAQTAKATEEIAAQVTQMQSATDHSVAAIKEIGSTIGQISAISSAIAAAVDQQGTVTQDIARNVQQAARGATEVTGSISDVNHGAQKTDRAASQVHRLAVSLLSESNQLTTEVETFLTRIKAA